MAVAFDAASNATQGTGELSWTHTPVGTPRGIVVFIVQSGAAADQVSGVTYGGTAMTEMAGSPILRAPAGEAAAVYGYFLGASIPTGAQTVVVTVTGADLKQACALSATADTDTELVDVDATTNSASVENPSVTLSLGGRTAWAAMGFFSGLSATTLITPLANWTSVFEDDFGVNVCGFYRYDTIGSTDVTAGWTQAADDAGAIAVAVAEVAANPTILVIPTATLTITAGDGFDVVNERRQGHGLGLALGLGIGL